MAKLSKCDSFETQGIKQGFLCGSLRIPLRPLRLSLLFPPLRVLLLSVRHGARYPHLLRRELLTNHARFRKCRLPCAFPNPPDQKRRTLNHEWTSGSSSRLPSTSPPP